jgi:hypothetical protein
MPNGEDEETPSGLAGPADSTPTGQSESPELETANPRRARKRKAKRATKRKKRRSRRTSRKKC